MKKLLILFIITIAILLTSKFAYAQTENVKPASRVGGTIGLQLLADGGMDNGFGLNIFLHQTISKRWFLSMNAGYHRHSWTMYSNGAKGEVIGNDIPFTLGINIFLATTGARPYFGIEAGLLNKSAKGSVFDGGLENTIAQSRGADLIIFSPIFGFSVPLSKNISLEGNVKFMVTGMSDGLGLRSTGINIGAAYLIP